MKFRVKKNKVKMVKGAHCGCCGKSLPEAIVESNWRWDICDTCTAE